MIKLVKYFNDTFDVWLYDIKYVELDFTVKNTCFDNFDRFENLRRSEWYLIEYGKRNANA